MKLAVMSIYDPKGVVVNTSEGFGKNSDTHRPETELSSRKTYCFEREYDRFEDNGDASSVVHDLCFYTDINDYIIYLKFDIFLHQFVFRSLC